MSSDDIRAAFLGFWQEKGSQVWPSSSLIPHNDPTVLLTTAGMQQFVPYFLGQVAAPSPPRLTSVQKCFRTVDIDEVGDPRHLTFFEMMGNFSVGDYFKAEVIPWSLEFLTERVGLERDRLWFSVHETDDEAREIWLNEGIPPARILKFGDRENWWGPPGRSGPCGPDSEIYYQQDAGHGCGFPYDPPDCDCGRLEIWNLVFMQYFQDEAGVRTPLDRKSVDTGIGLERTAMVVQDTPSVYETDLFTPVIERAARLSGVAYGSDPATDYALRVLGDHGRGMTFLVADGVVPGTGGREYVLRRVMRRAIRYGRRLGIEKPFLGEMAESVIERMAAHYPELVDGRARILQVVQSEEELFSRTLKAGTVRLERLVAEAREAGAAELTGAQVFDLYQTYGFPPELTEEAVREHGLSFDRPAYEAALRDEQGRARAGATFKHAVHAGENEFPGVPETEFLAWTEVQAEARVLAIHPGGAPADTPARPGQLATLVLEASPFYPEGGGQVGDAGHILTPGGVFQVEDTRLDGAGHILHLGRIKTGEPRVGELARAQVDADRRRRTMRHHTLTHLLHRALKDVLGEGTSQQGSLVSPEQARFDFNHPRALTPEQIQQIGAIVNDRAMQDLPVHWEVMPLEQARHTGAVMMFGEKYGDQVRVVSIGDYSRELCGGTHTHHSSELGLAAVVSETGIGSGKRRLVAYAGEAALAHLNGRLGLLEQLAERSGARSVDEAPTRLEQILSELELLRTELQRFRQERARAEGARLALLARDSGGIRVVAASLAERDEEGLKELVDAARETLGSGVVVLAAVIGGKPRFVVGVTRDLVSRGISAGNVLSAVARAAGGGGGGRPDFASGGGGDPARIGMALERAHAAVAEMARSAPR